mgnify:CR=1 FL=1
MPAYDPDLARLLDVARQAGRPPFEALTPVQARSAYAATWDILQPAAQDVASVRDSVVPGPDGDITVRVYRGIGTEASESLPCPGWEMITAGSFWNSAATATLLDIFDRRVALECWDHALPEERRTVRELHAIDGAHGKGTGKGDAALEPANDDTRNIDEFRRDLARKIDQLAAQYSEEGDRGA